MIRLAKKAEIPSNTLDLDGRDLIWLAVLGAVAGEKCKLKPILEQIERIAGNFALSPKVAICLQEMVKGGHVRLYTDGHDWTLAMGEQGPETLDRLLALHPHSHSPSLNKAFYALCQWIKDLRTEEPTLPPHVARSLRRSAYDASTSPMAVCR